MKRALITWLAIASLLWPPVAWAQIAPNNPVLRPVLSHPFPVVAGAIGSTQAVSSTSQVVSLPCCIQAGDLLVVLMAESGNGRTPSAAGWTFPISAQNMDSTGEVNGGWKLAAGNEGASVTVTLSGAATGAFSAYRIINWRGTPQFAATNSIDPPSINLATVHPLSPALWIAFWGALVSATTTPGLPPNYRDMVSATIANSMQAASGWRNEMINLEDPAAFTETGGAVTGRGTITVEVRGK